MKPIQRLIVAAVACVMTTVVSACSGVADGGEAQRTITVAQLADPTRQPDPIIDGSLTGFSWYYATYDSLVKLDKKGELVPQLAEEWSSSEDLRTWTFKIREGVKFHDGTDLTPEDVAFTFNSIMANPASNPRSYMQPLERAEVGENNTVKFHLSSPWAPFPNATSSVGIVPKAAYEEMGSQQFAQNPIGSGPYKFKKRTTGVNYIVERNDDYWGSAAWYDEVKFMIVADEAARVNGVISGSLDVAIISPNQVDTVTGAAKVVSQQSNGVVFLGMNSAEGPLEDKDVRNALELAINKQAIVSNVLDGRGDVATQMIAPLVGGFDSSVEATKYDPERAEELLEGSDYNGEEIVLAYASGGRIALSDQVAQAVQAMLNEVGFNIRLQGMDQSTLSDMIYTNKSASGLYLNTYAPSQMDGDPVVEDVFGGGWNDYAMSDESKDLVQETRMSDGEERIRAYGDLMRFNVENTLLVPLYVPESSYAVSNRTEFVPRADDLFVFADVSPN
ncbi:ABC transporter substrate-binding protein [Brevibacterium luteolum]|uniref:ABC transporter substrate-binding protein n=1 Tax=Brevibacterium luteolum TaxID=199591 RepID=UPI003B66E1BB